MNIDYIEKGEGQTVILLHFAAAGNRQWRHLIDFLCDDHHLIAPNLYGYGATDKWTFQRPQTLVDQAELIRQFITSDGCKFSLVKHSFGGSVAMMAAKLFHDRIDKLILIEPNPFSLLRALGHDANYNEVMALYDCIKLNRANGDWEIAGAVFANYWNGAGTWEAMGTDRKAKFPKALEPNFHEWDAVINEQTSINEWATFLPLDTMVLKCTKTVQSINSIF